MFLKRWQARYLGYELFGGDRTAGDPNTLPSGVIAPMRDTTLDSERNPDWEKVEADLADPRAVDRPRTARTQGPRARRGPAHCVPVGHQDVVELLAEGAVELGVVRYDEIGTVDQGPHGLDNDNAPRDCLGRDASQARDLATLSRLLRSGQDDFMLEALLTCARSLCGTMPSDRDEPNAGLTLMWAYVAALASHGAGAALIAGQPPPMGSPTN